MAQWAHHYDELLKKLGNECHLYPVIVQEARPDRHTPTKLIRKFYAFRTWSEYWLHQQSLPPEKRNYFESIKGAAPQKPHFDLDLDRKKHKYFLFNPEQLFDALVYAIMHVLAQHSITLRLDRDLLVFTSHDQTIGKWSYHLIVDNWIHRNHEEAKQFYELVMAELPAEYKVEPYVDHMVYSSFQQFRLVGNCKPGSKRVKRFERTWHYHGNEITNPLQDDYQIFNHSLVGSTSYCRYLPEMKRAVERREGGEQLPDDLSSIIALVPEQHFTFMKQVNNMLLFKRNQPGVELMCEICGYSHGGDNPFVMINEGQILFFCRRNRNNRPKLLGGIKKKEEESDKRNRLRRGLLKMDEEDKFCGAVPTKAQKLQDSLKRIYQL